MHENSIYAGIWGIPLIGEVDFGDGMLIRSTYVHVMTHTMLAFNRPVQAGESHPAPWKATTDNFGFDVEAELRVPATLARTKTSQKEVADYVVALLRLYVHPDIRLAIISDYPLRELANLDQLIVARQCEIGKRHFEFGDVPMVGFQERLGWVRDHWRKSIELTEISPEFRLAISVYHSVQFFPDLAMALVAIWGALEALFIDAKSELRFRVSSLIAAYMEPRGPSRSAAQKQIAKLYDKRSAAAHGSSKHGRKDILDSFLLLRSVLIQIVEAGKVPTTTELEARLFE